MTPDDAEALITDNIAKENSYLEQMLTEIDSTYISNDMMEAYILEEMGSHMKERSQDIYDQLEKEMESRDHKNSDDNLVALVKQLLDH